MRIDATARHRFPVTVSAALLCAAMLLAGCAAGREAVPAAGSGRTDAAAGAKSPSMKAELPEEIEVPLRLSPGDSWKSRFVSVLATVASPIAVMTWIRKVGPVDVTTT